MRPFRRISAAAGFRPEFFFCLSCLLLSLILASCEKEGAPPEPTQVGSLAPDFNLKDLAGSNHTLSAEKGKLVILRFWSTQCKSCREEMPKLDALYRTLAPSGVTLIAVNTGDATEKVRDYISDLGLTFPILMDEEKAAAKQYRVYGVPTSFIIDRQGITRERFFGDRSEEEMKTLIKPYL